MLSDPVKIALITTIPTIGVTITGFLVAYRGYLKDKREWERDRANDRIVRDDKLQEIHEQVNGNNAALTRALSEANERLARAGEPVVKVIPIVKDAAA